MICFRCDRECRRWATPVPHGLAQRPGAADDVIDSFAKALEDARRVGGAGVTLYAHNLAESPVRGSVDRKQVVPHRRTTADIHLQLERQR